MKRGFILGLCALLCLLCAGGAQATDLFVLKTKTKYPVLTINDQGNLWHKGTLTANLASIPAPASNIDAWVLRDAAGSIKMLVELSNLSTGQVLGNVKIRGGVAGGTPPTGTPGANDVSIRNSAGTEVARLSATSGGVNLSGIDDTASYVDSNQYGRLKLSYNGQPPHTLYRGHLVWLRSSFVPFDGADLGSGYFTYEWTNQGTSGWASPPYDAPIVGYPSQNQAFPTCTCRRFNYNGDLVFTLTGSFPLTFKEPTFLAVGELILLDYISNPKFGVSSFNLGEDTTAPWFNDQYNGGYFHHDVSQGPVVLRYQGDYAAITPEGNPYLTGGSGPTDYPTFVSNSGNTANKSASYDHTIPATVGTHQWSYPDPGGLATTYNNLLVAAGDTVSPTAGTFQTLPPPRTGKVYQIGDPTWIHPVYELDSAGQPKTISPGVTINPPDVVFAKPGTYGAPYKAKLRISDPVDTNFFVEKTIALTDTISGGSVIFSDWNGEVYYGGNQSLTPRNISGTDPDYVMQVTCFFDQNLNNVHSEFHMSWDDAAKYDLDIRETGDPENRVGRDDPRQDSSVRNRILIWASGGIGAFDLVKPPGATGPVAVEFEDRNGQNQSLAPLSVLTAHAATFTFIATDDNDNEDIIVKFGKDLNSDHHLVGSNEVLGTYHVYGVTQDEYADSRSNYSSYLALGLWDLADELQRHFAYGILASGGYHPTTTSGSTVLPADRFTHWFGASFSGSSFDEQNGRFYYNANATLPIYHYDDNTNTSDLILESSALSNGLQSFVDGLTYTRLATDYAAASGPVTKSIWYSLGGVSFDFGPTGRIGLGGTTVDGDIHHPTKSVGRIQLQITPNGPNSFIIEPDANVEMTIRDVFDFNYFNASWKADYSDASRSAAMIQCGYGKAGSVTGVGRVVLVDISVNGSVTITGRTVNK